MLYDLSHPLTEATPTYPGDPATKIVPSGTHEASGYEDHYVSIGTHVGTHMDAPSHMISGGKTLDTYPLECFMGKGIYIDARNGFSPEAIETVNAGDIVLFYTGMSGKYHDPAYFTDYPAMSEEMADLLIKKGVSIVGVDTCSVDNVDGFPVHKKLLGADVLIIENLANLELLAGKVFVVRAFPLNLALDGAPVRVIAETE